MHNKRAMTGLIGAVLLSAALALLTSASRLNTAWLVPAGNVKVDYKRLDQPAMKICALTFDDGPDGKYTPQVASILSHYHIQATFFVIGRRVESNPQVVLDLAAAGFEIGNHSQDHPQMTKLSLDRQRSEIQSVQDLLGKRGITPRWFRPPYGAFNATTVSAASKLGLETVLWSVDPRDWSEPGVGRIQSRVLSGVTPGAVILLHSTHGQTVEALPGIIEGLQKQGYRFVTMSEWAKAISGKLPLGNPGESVLPASNAGAPPPGLQIEPEEAVALPEEQSFRSPGSVSTAPPTLVPGAPAAPAPAASAAAAPPTGPAPPSPANTAPPVTNETIVPEDAAPAASPAAAPPAAPAAAAQPVRTMENDLLRALDTAALLIRANFDDPAQATSILQGAAGGKLRLWLGGLEAYGGVSAHLAQLNPGLFGPGANPTPAAASATSTPPAGASRNTFPLSGDGAWGGAWQPAASLNLSTLTMDERVLAENRFRPAPKYYLLGIGNYTDADVWDGVNSFFTLARLDGLLLSDQTAFTAAAGSAPTPKVAAPASQLASGAMVDLTLQSLSSVLAALQQGYGNIYLTVRPNMASEFSGDSLNALGSGQQEFVLFRRLTAGLGFDAAPQNDFAPSWPLPPGIQLARFFDPGHEVLVLYSPEGNRTPFTLPTAAHDYSVAQFDDEGRLAIRPLVETTQVLGRKTLLLYRELH